MKLKGKKEDKQAPEGMITCREKGERVQKLISCKEKGKLVSAMTHVPTAAELCREGANG